MDIKIAELMNKMKYPLAIGEALLTEYEELEPCCKNILNYTDVLCMTDRTQIEAFEGEKRISKIKSMRYVFINNIFRLFLDTQNADLRVKLFYSLDLKAFFDYLESVHQNREVRGCYYRLAAWLNLDEDSEMTVGNAVKAACEMTMAYWHPWDETSEYRSKIMKGYYALEAIYLQAFRKGVPERFNFEDIYAKCRDYQRTMGREEQRIY